MGGMRNCGEKQGRIKRREGLGGAQRRGCPGAREGEESLVGGGKQRNVFSAQLVSLGIRTACNTIRKVAPKQGHNSLSRTNFEKRRGGNECGGSI